MYLLAIQKGEESMKEFRHYESTIVARGNLEFVWEINFLAKAISHDDRRIAMQDILIETSDKNTDSFKGVSTDGKRLHIVDPLSCSADFGLKAGLWKVLKYMPTCIIIAKNSLDKEADFPNYRQVIPKEPPVFKDKFLGISLKGKRLNNNVLNAKMLLEAVRFIRSFPEPTAFDFRHLIDLGMRNVWEVRWYSRDKCVIFESCNYLSVIMPK
jgi:hypothetical protein